LIKYYHDADVFAMPNRTMPDGDTEGFGLVFLEATAAKTATIGGDAGGVPCAVNNGETGLLVDGNNIEDIAEKLELLIKDSILRDKMAVDGHKYAATQNWQEKAQDFQAILQSVCAA
jgi:phosphatidylinositol alpha-1,6-mannosyltransferase